MSSPGFQGDTPPQRAVQLSEGAIDPGSLSLTGLDIDVSVNPEIATRREQLSENIEGIKQQVQGTITGIQQQIENINNLSLPEIDTARFDQITQQGEQQRGQLLQIDQGLGTQITQLEEAYQRLGESSNAFVEARTRGLMENREQARRDASRRGISGPLSALATNPIDSQIADERSKAAQDVADAQLNIRKEQRALQQTRLQVQQQFEQVRQGELTAVSEKFSQADQRFQAGRGQAVTAAGLEELVQGGASILQSLSSDQSGLNQQAFAQEITELGLGNEIFQMIVNSQLVTPTAQTSDSFGTSESSGGGDRWGDLWSNLKDFSGDFLFKKGGIFEPTIAQDVILRDKAGINTKFRL